MRPVVILDTSMLFAPFQFSFNLDIALENFVGKVEVVVPSSVIKELEGLEKSSILAKTVKKFAEKYRIVEVNGKGDKGIVECVSKFPGCEVYVATQDRKLSERLRKRGIKILFLREGQRLALRER